MSENHFNRGTQLQALGHAQEAVEHFRAALALRPDHVEALVNLGNGLQQLGQTEAGLDCYRRALALRPEFLDVHLNLGAALQALGRYDEAIRSYQAAIAQRGSDARLHNNLGIVLRESGQFEEAELSFRAALRLQPDVAVIEQGLAGILLAQGRTAQAEEHYRRAAELDPRDAKLAQGLAKVLSELGRLAEAEEHYRRAVQLDPWDADIAQGLGDVLRDRGQWGESCEQYRQALDLEPALAKTWSGLLMRMLYSDTTSPMQSWRDHGRFAARFEGALAGRVRGLANLRDPGRRLKIGYVSADFRSHSVAYFFEPVLARHDRSAFEIHCYNVAANHDAVTARMRGAADGWVEGARMSDEQLAERIRADGIDILVDLSGHTAGNRLLAFARKPAPVQLTWLGYPSPSGLRQVDYYLSDSLASPPGADLFAEEGRNTPVVYRLPRIFCVYRPPSFAPEPRRAPDSSGASITLGSFNSAAKISDRTVLLWSRLLNARPDLRLMLKDRRFANCEFRAAMVGRFAVHGIAEERLDLLSRAESDVEHLARYAQVAIALDTFPYCGVTTTCEALWMGVPVVSLAGEGIVSRMGLTLLTAVGHAEWLAVSEDEYLEKVLALAADARQRESLRHGLRDQMRASQLMDEVRFIRDLESGYRDMWRRWCARA